MKISIPYGAIKSLTLEGKKLATEIFQFLMVRLKGCYSAAGLFWIVKISIPYGAIKREARIQLAESFEKFQFLMVRLKDKNLLTAKYQHLYFNSLWCD